MAFTDKHEHRHPGTRHLLQYLQADGGQHLPEGSLRDMFQAYGGFAEQVVEHAPDGPELTVALRKLLESKDAAVRALLGQEQRP